VFWKHLSILGSTMCNKQEFRDVMRLAFEGTLKAVVDQAMPLAEARTGQLMLEERRHFGKIVLHPW
jgi:NADPH:quinone reductase-like Zn-dependent oxidoreductase